MNQVGETKQFALSVTPPEGTGIYAYCWRFWDNTVAVTTVPRVEKTFNIGGDPSDSRLLYFTCQPVSEDGQSTILTGSVEVNNPPYVVPSPVVSNNDDYFPYQTQISVTAYDVEGDSLSFLYYDAEESPIGGGSTTALGPIAGTWNGTYGLYDGFQNVFETTISSETTLTLKIVDSALGTRSIDFDFFGETPIPPVIGVTADPDSLTADATSIPDQRIGPGQTVSFSVYASDPVSPNFEFLWSFWGSHGWAENSFVAGESEPTADGSVRNSYVKSIEDESGGDKTVFVRVTNTDSGKEVEIPVYVSLVANTTASSATLTVTDTHDNELAAGDDVPAGTKLFYRIEAEDPQNDVLQYKWTVTQPSGVEPSSLNLWGPSIMIDTTGYPSGASIPVSCRTIDRMEGQAVFSAPTVVIS